MKSLLFILVFCLTATASADSRCIAYNSQTAEIYYGQCSMGRFSAYDMHSGYWIWGTCMDMGAVNAWHPKTGAWIYGSCHLP